MVDLKHFQRERVLLNDTSGKVLVLLGQIHGQAAIVSLEKTIFPNDFDIASGLSDELQLIEQNDVYSWFLGSTTQAPGTAAAPREGPGGHCSVKINVICPATETHLKKYSEQQLHMVSETPQMYTEVVVPFIKTMVGDRIQWVRNILFHGAEADKVVHANDEFVLLPDMKWDGINTENLYCVAIVKRQDVFSLRDLTKAHRPWLQMLNSEIKQLVSTKYGLAQDQLRLFVHYQPSYYHFHIHCVNVSHKGLNDGINAGKAWLLDDVIDQLNYVDFKDRTLTYVIGDNHKLYGLLTGAN